LDITERKLVDVALRESEERLRLAQQAADIGMWSWNLSTGKIKWTPELEQQFGYTRGTFPENYPGFSDRVHPEDITEMERNRDAAIAAHLPFDLDFRVLLPSAEIRWLNSKGAAHYDDAGKPQRVFGVNVDITRRKRMEADLRTSEEKFRRIFETTATMGSISTLKEGRIIDVNQAFTKCLGFTREEVVGKTSSEIGTWVDYEDRKRAAEALAVTGSLSNFEIFLRAKSGELRTGLLDASLMDIGGERCVVAFFMDITERKQTDRALRESERRERERAGELSAVLNAAPTPVFIAHDTECRHLSGNIAATELLRQPQGSETSLSAPEQVRPRHFKAFKDGRELRTDELPAQRAAKGEPIRDFEFYLEFDDGEIRHVLGYGTPLFDEREQPRGAVHILVDITERKHSEEALRAANAHLSAIMDAAQVAILVAHDPQCRKITGNDLAQRLLGTNRSNLSATPADNEAPPLWRAFRDGNEVKGEDLPMQRAARSGRMIIDEEVDIVTPSGEKRTVISTAAPMRDASGAISGVVCTLLDITARKQAEEDLRRLNEGLENLVQERTDKLRRLASELTLVEQRERKNLSRILHDGLQQYLVAAKMQLSDLHSRIQNAGRKQEAATIEHLLDQAVQVSRSLAAELSPPILRDAGILAGLEWLSRWMFEKHGLKVQLNMEMDAPALAEDIKILLFESVREMLLNVVKHAHTRFAKIHLFQAENNHLGLAVSDDGKGFEINHETPDDQKGFGLFSIRERLSMMGGSLQIDSAPGKGAILTITAPLGQPEPLALDTSSPPSLGPETQAPAISAEREKVTILLVDDHAVMREGLSRLLSQEADFEVIGQAENGQEAVEQATTLQPDVICMDISMPIMGGIEATRIIHRAHPSIRIIGLSLYTEDERAKAMIEAGASFYMSKAGRPSELVAAIRTCCGKEKRIPPIRKETGDSGRF
jgi:PAS domain S-box-containing protein